MRLHTQKYRKDQPVLLHVNPNGTMPEPRFTPSGEVSVSVVRNILMRMFSRPRGVLGKLGGIIMARSNREMADWVIGLLKIHPTTKY